MRYLYLLSLIVTFLVGCNSSAQKNEQSLRAEIIQLEDSIAQVSMNLKPGESLDLNIKNKLISKLKEYYTSYPNDKYAPEYIDKLHMVYIGEGDHQTAIKYADTLLKNYKDYINRPMILESMANTYDMFVNPRDTVKVKYYNTLLLEENPDMSKEKREEILFRLKHINLTIDELIDLQIEKMMQD